MNPETVKEVRALWDKAAVQANQEQGFWDEWATVRAVDLFIEWLDGGDPEPDA